MFDFDADASRRANAGCRIPLWGGTPVGGRPSPSEGLRGTPVPAGSPWPALSSPDGRAPTSSTSSRHEVWQPMPPQTLHPGLRAAFHRPIPPQPANHARNTGAPCFGTNVTLRIGLSGNDFDTQTTIAAALCKIPRGFPKPARLREAGRVRRL